MDRVEELAIDMRMSMQLSCRGGFCARVNAAGIWIRILQVHVPCLTFCRSYTLIMIEHVEISWQG